MQTLRCCVIDDEPLASGLIRSYIEKTPFLELAGEFSSPRDAISTILNDQVDIVFLDIQMPQLNGIEFARIIPSETRIIFTTAYSDYAVEGFRVNALDYLLKPISYEEFLAAANRALAWCELKRQSETSPSQSADQADGYIIVKSEYKLVQVRIADILYRRSERLCQDLHGRFRQIANDSTEHESAGTDPSGRQIHASPPLIYRQPLKNQSHRT